MYCLPEEKTNRQILTIFVDLQGFSGNFYIFIIWIEGVSESSRFKIFKMSEQSKNYTLSNEKHIEVSLTSKTVSPEAAGVLFQKTEEEVKTLIEKASKRFGLKDNGENYNLHQIICAGYVAKNCEISAFKVWLLETQNPEASEKEIQEISDQFFKDLRQETDFYLIDDLVFWYHICELCIKSVNFDKKPTSIEEFFEEMQNKMYWAAFRLTPAEMVHQRIGSEKPYLGLHRFLGEIPEIFDVLQARNYLTEEEEVKLSGLINFYWSISVKQLIKEGEMTKRDWISKLEGLLQMTGYLILINDGNVSNTQMEEYAKEEYGKFIESF